MCVLLYIFSTCTHIRHMTELGLTRGHLPAFLVPYPSTSRVQNTPLPPLTLRVFPHPGATETGIRTHSTSFPSRLLIPHRRHPLGAVRARARYTDTVHNSCPCTVPPSWRAKVRLRVSKATAPQTRSPVVMQVKGTRRGQFRHELMHVLQNAFESNWYGPGRSLRDRRRKKKPAKEVVVVDDDEDEEEGEREQEEDLPTILDLALAMGSHPTRRVLTWLQWRRPRLRLKD